MNAFDDILIDPNSFSFDDLTDQDSWNTFVPVFTSLTLVGAETYLARFHLIGRQCFFQVKLSAATSIASTAGTTYMALPIAPARGLAGVGVMTDLTTNVAVGLCSIDVANSRLYLPTQGASGDTFLLAGWYEI